MQVHQENPLKRGVISLHSPCPCYNGKFTHFSLASFPSWHLMPCNMPFYPTVGQVLMPLALETDTRALAGKEHMINIVQLCKEVMKWANQQVTDIKILKRLLSSPKPPE